MSMMINMSIFSSISSTSLSNVVAEMEFKKIHLGTMGYGKEAMDELRTALLKHIARGTFYILCLVSYQIVSLLYL